MVSHPETGSDLPIRSDRESGHDNSSVMLLISYHLPYSCHLQYSYHLFLYFMPAYTLEVDTGNYKGLKALLSLYETMTSIRS